MSCAFAHASSVCASLRVGTARSSTERVAKFLPAPLPTLPVPNEHDAEHYSAATLCAAETPRAFTTTLMASSTRSLA